MFRACVPCGLLYRDGADFCGVDGSAILETDEDPLVGRRVAQYEVLGRLAIGGVAAIYRARHQDLGHEVALKILLGEMASQPSVVERFRREAYAACRIVHPHVVRTFDFGTTDRGVVFVIMELLQGNNLAECLADKEGLPAPLVRHLLRQITEGLQAIHALGYVHRDIKPGNVMLVEGCDGRPWSKIIDFGLVRLGESHEEEEDRLTRQGTVIGTPQYISPEVIAGAPPTPATDLYGLGATLYEMLAGRPPFTGSLSEVLLAHLQEHPRPIQGAGALGSLAVALLAKDAENRPRSAESVLAWLDAPPRRRRVVGRVGLTAGLAAVLAVILLGSAGMAVNYLRTVEGPRSLAGGEATPRGRLDPLPEPLAKGAGPPVPPPSGVGAPSSVSVSFRGHLDPSSPDVAEGPPVPPPSAKATEAKSTPESVASMAPRPSVKRKRLRRGRRSRRSKALSSSAVLPKVVEVQINSVPAGAEVSTLGGILGRTPLMAILPTAKPLTLVIKKAGYEARSIRWRPESRRVVKVSLRRKAR